MADIDLDAIKARAEAAHPGPWNHWPEAGWIEVYQGGSIEEGGPFGDVIAQGVRPVAENGHDWRSPEGPSSYDAGIEHNAEFIAHARTDVPELVAEVERLRAVLTRTDEADGSVIDILEAERDVLRAQREAVLGLHRDATMGDGSHECTVCVRVYGAGLAPQSWPCPTARALGVTE